jgi:hypothetical protein
MGMKIEAFNEIEKEASLPEQKCCFFKPGRNGSIKFYFAFILGNL